MHLHLPYLRLRRWLFFGLAAATTTVGVGMMLAIVRDHGITLLEVVILLLFALMFGWIAIAFWNAVFGFVLILCRCDPLSLQRARPGVDADEPISTRTALVMPVHNEDPARVMNGLCAMWRSLGATGYAANFDLHLLSDTTDPGVARAEEQAWNGLCRQLDEPARLHYRRRPSNVGRKAGNIAEFCRRAGTSYDFMIVLDADSIMRGTAIVELVRAMEATPDAGLIQTLPIPAGRTSLFGRLLQFAAALYSPMLATGQSFWQADAANYWGHNAIVRAQAFDAYCGLPVLPGRPPLGGAILSHDFVEAALLRRAGWRVYLRPDIDGSYEEVPASIPDYAVRDRRWAQGSLQHLRLLTMPGWHPMSRVHFALGAMGYVSSLLWLLMLLASTGYVIVPLAAADWFTDDRFLVLADRPMPWNVSVAVGQFIPLLAITIALLFLPKVLGLVLGLARSRESFGGARRLLVSAALELAFAVAVAPVMMMYHSRFVVSVLAGRDIRWASHSRVGRAVPWREAWRRTVGVNAVGATWAAVTLYFSPGFFLWLTPIVVGLLLAMPLVAWTSRGTIGLWTRRAGFFLVPSEIVLPPELKALDAMGVTPAGGLAPERHQAASSLAIDAAARR